jgi:hypothetical protein
MKDADIEDLYKDYVLSQNIVSLYTHMHRCRATIYFAGGIYGKQVLDVGGETPFAILLKKIG